MTIGHMGVYGNIKSHCNVSSYHIDVDFSGLEELFIPPLRLKGNRLRIAVRVCVCVCV